MLSRLGIRVSFLGNNITINGQKCIPRHCKTSQRSKTSHQLEGIMQGDTISYFRSCCSSKMNHLIFSGCWQFSCHLHVMTFGRKPQLRVLVLIPTFPGTRLNIFVFAHGSIRHHRTALTNILKGH